MATLTNLIDSIRAATAIDSSQVVTDTVIKLWVNEDYFPVRRKVAEIVPDRYTAVATFDVTAGQSSYTIAAADFAKARKVGRRSGSGTAYLPLPLAPFATAERASALSWRQRGVVLDFFPLTAAPNTAGVDNYQLTYITKPTALASGADVVDLPDGVERVLVQLVSAKVRVRLGDDPSAHLALAKAYWEEERAALANLYPGQPEGIADVTGFWA